MTMTKLVRTGWISRQHGAWPMTLVPVFAGSALGGFTWTQLLLSVSWVLAFLCFDVLTSWIRAVAPRRKMARGNRYLPALFVYCTLAGIGLVALVILHPQILRWAVVIFPCFLISTTETLRGNYQSYLSRATAIIASCSLTPIAFELGSHPEDWSRAWAATIMLAAYFLGTIPYVKTLIRERDKPGWLVFSMAFHLVVTAASLLAWRMGMVPIWFFLAWVVLTVRAWVFPALSRRSVREHGRPLRPAVFGSSEFLFTAMVLASVLVN